MRSEKTENEPGWISKWGVRCLFMARACVSMTECWLIVAAMMIPADQMGRTLISAFSSSTCLTVHRLHGSVASPSGVMSFEGVLIMHALFRNLNFLHEYVQTPI